MSVTSVRIPRHIVQHLIGDHTHSLPGELNVVEEVLQPLDTSAVLVHFNLSVYILGQSRYTQDRGSLP